MSTPVLMPALSPTMTEGKLAKWHVKVGDDVKSGQVICEIETDKATMEVEAVDYARSGKGPYILEMQTYRYRGHSMSDPAKYRSKEEVDKYRNERDPIDHVRKILLDEKKTDEAALKAVDAEIRKIVNDAAEYAQHSPEPDPSELWTDVLVEA